MAKIVTIFISKKTFYNVCFTANNWTVELRDKLEKWSLERCNYAVWGEEIGESGTPHLQGYLEFKKGLEPRGTALSKIGNNSINWEERYFKCTSGVQPSLYCKKGEQSHSEWEEFKEIGPNYGLNWKGYEWGELKQDLLKQEKSKMKGGIVLKKLGELVKSGEVTTDIIMNNPETMVAFHQYGRTLKAIENHRNSLKERKSERTKGIWLYGPSGCGKTWIAMMKNMDGKSINNPYIHTAKDNGFFNNYNGEEVAIFDEYRPPKFGKQGIEFEDLLSLADDSPVKVKVKNGSPVSC